MPSSQCPLGTTRRLTIYPMTTYPFCTVLSSRYPISNNIFVRRRMQQVPKNYSQVTTKNGDNSLYEWALTLRGKVLRLREHFSGSTTTRLSVIIFKIDSLPESQLPV